MAPNMTPFPHAKMVTKPRWHNIKIITTVAIGILLVQIQQITAEDIQVSPSLLHSNDNENSIYHDEESDVLSSSGSSTSNIEMPEVFSCPAEGLYAHNYECQLYYRCETQTNGYIKAYLLSCKKGSIYSRALKLCMPPMLANREECQQYINEIDTLTSEDDGIAVGGEGVGAGYGDGGDVINSAIDDSIDSRLMHVLAAAKVKGGIANNGNAMDGIYNQWQNYGLTGLSGVSVISFSTSSARSAGVGGGSTDNDQGPPCKDDGFMSDPDDCTVFYRCISNGRTFNKIGFRCSDATAWDESLQSCNHLFNVRANGGCQGKQGIQMDEYNNQQTSTQSSQTSYQNSTSSSSSQQQSSTSSSSSSSSSSSNSSSSSSQQSSTQSSSTESSASSSNQQSSTSSSNHQNSTQSSNNQSSNSNSGSNNQNSNSNSQNNNSNSQNNSQSSAGSHSQNANNQTSNSNSQNNSNNQSSSGSNSDKNQASSSNSNQGSNTISSSGSTKPSPTECEDGNTYIPDKGDCAKFYRCRDDGKGGLETVPFTCGPGTVWNQEDKVCVLPTESQREKCRITSSSSTGGQQGSSSNNQTVSSSNQSSSSTNQSGSNNQTNHQSSSSNNQSNASSNNGSSTNNQSQSSGNQSASSNNNQQGSANNQASSSNNEEQQQARPPKPSNPSGKCQNSETYLPDKIDCSRFYRCVDNGKGGFDRIAFDCAPGTVWDPDSKGCNHPTDVQKEQCRVMASGGNSGSSSSSSSGSNSENQGSSSNNQGTQSSSSSTGENQQSQTGSQSSQGSSTSSGSNQSTTGSQSGSQQTTENNQSSNSQNQSSNNNQSSGSSSSSQSSSSNSQSGSSTSTTESNNSSQSSTSSSNNQGASSSSNNQGSSSSQSNNTTQTTTQKPFKPATHCENEETFLEDKEDCSKFYRCTDNGKGGYNKVSFKCPPSTVWHPQANSCDHPDKVKNLKCKMPTSSSSSTESSGTSSTSTSSSNQSSGSSSSSSGQQSGSSTSQETSTSQSSTQGSSSSGQQSGSSTSQATSTSQSSTQGSSSSSSQSGASSSQESSNAQSSNQGSSSTQSGSSSSSSSQGSNSSSQQSGSQSSSSGSSQQNPAGECYGSNQYLEDSRDCAKFYRCVGNSKGGYDKVVFTCGPGTVWDSQIQGCNHAWAVKNRKCGIGSESETKPTTTQGSLTTSKPMEQKPTQASATAGPTTMKPGFTKPTSTTSSTQGSLTTSKPMEQKPTQASATSRPTTMQPPTTGGAQPEGICRTEGFARDPNDCTRFYRCVSNGRGGFTQYSFRCGDGTVWDSDLQTCNHDFNKCNPNNGGQGQPGYPPTTHRPQETTTSKPGYQPTTQKPHETTSVKPGYQPTTQKPQESTTGKPGYQPTTQRPQETVTSKPGYQPTTQKPQDTTSVKPGYQPTTTEKPQETTTSKPGYQPTTQRPQETITSKPGYQPTTQKPQETTTGKPGYQPTTTQKPQQTTTGKPGYQPSTQKPQETTTGKPGYQPSTQTPQETTTSKPGYQPTTEYPPTTPTGKYPDATTTGQPTTTTMKPTPNEPITSYDKCSKEGFFGDIDDCQKFYRCVDNGNGGFEKYSFKCANNTVWDSEIKSCNHPSAIADPRCSIGAQTTTTDTYYTTTTNKYETTTMKPPTTMLPTTYKPSMTTTASTSNGEFTTTMQTTSTTPIPNLPAGSKCQGEGFMADPDNCRIFYRCIKSGAGFEKHEFKCARATGWSEDKQTCDHRDNIDRCRGQTEEPEPETTTLEYGSTTTEKYSSTTMTITTTAFEKPTTTGYDKPTTTTTKPSTTTYKPTTSYPTSTMDTESTTIPSTINYTTTMKPTSTTPVPNLPPGNKCTGEGFMADPDNCRKFYRCEKGNNDYSKHEFMCSKGTAWSEEKQTCDHRDNIDRCQGQTEQPEPESTTIEYTTGWPSSTTPSQSTTIGYDKPTTTTIIYETTSSSQKPTTTMQPTSTTPVPNLPAGNICQGEGFMADPNNCRKFYRCEKSGNSYSKYEFMCSKGTGWNEEKQTCDHRDNVDRCQGQTEEPEPETTTMEYTTSRPLTTNPNQSTTTEYEKPTTTTTYYETTTSSSQKPFTTTTEFTTIPSTTTDYTTASTTPLPNLPAGNKCKGEGFMADPDNCRKFYRCEKSGNDYSKHEFMCAKGTGWSEEKQTCDHRVNIDRCQGQTEEPEPETTTMEYTTFKPLTTTQSQTTTTTEYQKPTTTNPITPPSTTTETSSTITDYSTTMQPTSTTPVPNLPAGTKCKGEGFMADPDNCRKFYRCTMSDGKLQKHEFMCGKGTGWSEDKQTCDHVNNIERCRGQTEEPETTTIAYETTTTKPTATTTTKPIETTTKPIPTTTMKPGYVPTTTEAISTTLPSTTMKPGYVPTTTEATTTTESSALPTTTTKPGYVPTTAEATTTTESSALPTTTTKPGYVPTTTEATTTTESSALPTTTTKPGYVPTTTEAITTSEPSTQPQTTIKPGYVPTTTEATTTLEPSTLPPTTMQPSDKPGYLPTTTEAENITAPTTMSTTTEQYESTTMEPINHNCTAEGFFPDAEDCNRYYRCVDSEKNGKYQVYSFRCPKGTVWDTSLETCNYAEKVSGNCSSVASTTEYPIATQITTTRKPETTTTGKPKDTTTTGKPETTTTESPKETTTMGRPETTTNYETTTSKPDSTTTTEYPKETTTTGKPETTTTENPKETTTTEKPVETTTTTKPMETTTTEESKETSTPGKPTETTTPTEPSITTTQEPSTEPSGNMTAPCPPTSAGQNLFICPTGFRRHPKKCNMFYQCTEKADSYDQNIIVFECPNGMVYHENLNKCDSPKSGENCDLTPRTQNGLFEDEYKHSHMIQIRSAAPLCPTEGHFALNDDECGQLFVKCQYSAHTERLEGQIFRCPKGFTYWSVSRRCERAQKLQNCATTKYDVSSSIPVEWSNISNRRRNLKV